MRDLPLSIVISALISDGKILLIKRTKGDYIGCLGLPGGKVEMNEHLSQAAIREIEEESGISSTFIRHLGVVSEHLIEDNRISGHFLLHVCELKPHSTDILNDIEGKLDWFELDSLERIKERMIPSDYEMIERLVLAKGSTKKHYYDCIIEKIGNSHILKKFE